MAGGPILKSEPEYRSLLQRQVADAFGVDVRTIARWIKKGMPRNEDGRLDLPECINWAVDQAKISLEPPPKETSEHQYWTTEFKKERTKIVKLERKEIQKRLIPSDQAVKWLVQLVTEARAAFLAFPRRMAPVLYGADLRDIEKKLKKEIGEILTTLARPLERESESEAQAEQVVDE